MIMRRFPILKSPTDVRDHIVGTTVLRDPQNIPETYSVKNALLPVRDQKQTSMCGAFSAATIKEYQEKIDINLNEYLSPEYLYYYRPNKDTDGMYLKDIMAILLKQGICRENTWKFEKQKPSDDKLVEATNHKIKNYARCDTIQDAKKAIYLTGPILFSVPVYNTSVTTFWKRSSDMQILQGGHAMTMVGYTKDSFIVRNSWGTNWGDDGYTEFPFSDFDIIWDIYCSYDLESDKSYKYDGLVIPVDKISKCKCIIM